MLLTLACLVLKGVGCLRQILLEFVESFMFKEENSCMVIILWSLCNYHNEICFKKKRVLDVEVLKISIKKYLVESGGSNDVLR